MNESDVEAAHKLSLAVRWPHRVQDWKFIQRLGAGYVAEDDNGVVGTAMCWSHGTEYASVGMVIVGTDWQRKGIGKRMMGMVMGELGKRNVLLHSTDAARELYQRMGFTPVGAVHQHQGTVFEAKLVPLQSGERVRPMGSRDQPKLAALAARASGMPRGTVLAALLETAECVVLDRYDELIGCAMLRRFGHGYAIGPVIAPDIDRAKTLISHWTGTYAGSFVRIDVPANSGLSPWLDELGLVQVDTVHTMVRGEPPPQDPAMHVYAIINQALG
ncbi:GNAT family N-acetyltransferase [Massilia cavernae]|uniref:N-acetyltransferase n=1 Tax=Massilia cavernae TaxID=2320864 RepID=A0A418XY09_9BURK|nr:GNAT family N-acetyltransferase [Massilia cavernae]RJG17882.1 N-acetyltransferase [Massilia cavernae]